MNKRVNPESLNPLFYGHCLSRLTRYIVSIRLRLPTVKILGCKTDFKAAYRRITLHGDTAARCFIMFKDWDLASLRLTFGGSPCPNEFCIVSEICADIANDLMHCPDWSPEEIHSPHKSLLQPSHYLAPDIPIGQAAPLDFSIPMDDWGRTDIFIDDGITIVPDINNNWGRGRNAMPLAIHLLSRGLSTDEPLSRDDPLSLSKFTSEGSMSEVLTVLGWQLNLRSLEVSLPRDKFLAWKSNISKILQAKKASVDSLESLLGWLNHVAIIIPLSSYFLNRIRRHIDQTASKKPNLSKSSRNWIGSSVLEDISLFDKIFLPKAHTGINMNLITYRRPTHILWSDTCPSGLGGFSTNTGSAWRFQIPISFSGSLDTKNNWLEFLAAIITIWLETRHPTTPRHSCFLTLGDNASAVGWLHKANVNEETSKPLQTMTRHLASLLMEADCCINSQHFWGIHNNVADALSREHHLTDKDLVRSIHSRFSHQAPSTLAISPLPPEISSWVICLLQKFNEKQESQKEHKRKRTECGNGGYPTSRASTSPTTHSSKDWTHQCIPGSSAPSPQPYDDEPFRTLVKKTWEAAQCKRPWQNWVRSIGQTWGTTPTMERETLAQDPTLA